MQDRLRTQKEMNRTQLPRFEEEKNNSENIIDKIRNIDNQLKIKKKHIKSRSLYQNPFVKFEYSHPGKYIKFEHETMEIWSCCIS